MGRPLIIVGAGGFGREVRTVFQEEIRQAGFVVKGFLGRDHGAGRDATIEPLMLGDPESYQPQADDCFVLAVGDMRHRRRIVETLQNKGGKFVTLVHRHAFVAPNAQLAEGVLVYPFAVVSSEAILEQGVKLNFYASAGHNVRLGPYCLLAPYATVNGFSVLESEVYMSTHATVGPQVKVGARAKLSANTAITRDVPEGGFVFGVPGRIVTHAPLTEA